MHRRLPGSVLSRSRRGFRVTASTRPLTQQKSTCRAAIAGLCTRSGAVLLHRHYGSRPSCPSLQSVQPQQHPSTTRHTHTMAQDVAHSSRRVRTVVPPLQATLRAAAGRPRGETDARDCVCEAQQQEDAAAVSSRDLGTSHSSGKCSCSIHFAYLLTLCRLPYSNNSRLACSLPPADY